MLSRIVHFQLINSLLECLLADVQIRVDFVRIHRLLPYRVIFLLNQSFGGGIMSSIVHIVLTHVVVELIIVAAVHWIKVIPIMDVIVLSYESGAMLFCDTRIELLLKSCDLRFKLCILRHVRLDLVVFGTIFSESGLRLSMLKPDWVHFTRFSKISPTTSLLLFPW